MATTEEDLIGFFEKDYGHRETADANTTTSNTSIVSDATVVTGNLNKIIETKENLAKVKGHLEKIFDIIEKNPSFITRVSTEFGNWPIWKKVGVGFALSGSTLLTGVATSMSALIVLGGTTGLAYASTAAILEDHHSSTVNASKTLKGGILSIVEVLNVTILALDNIRLQLALEVAKFKKENLRLAGHVSSLSDKVSTLTIEIGILMTTSDFIKEDKEHLEEELVRLKANNEIQNDLLEEQQAAVDKALADYNATQLELKVQISELEKTRREMTSVISNTKVISQALDHAVTSLTNSEASCQKKNQDFLDKLESFCTNDTTDANALRERLETTETTIDNATRDLSSDHLNDKELLVREERVIMELEALSLKAQEYVNNKENISNNKTKGLGASAPGGAGLFSKSASVQKMSEEGISYKVVSFR